MPDHVIPAASEFPVRNVTESAGATAALGAAAARLLQGGETLLLFGPLGAGKTCFVQGLCRELNVREDVISPSFTLANRYCGRLVVHHLDFYRIGPEDDLMDIGVDELLDEVSAGESVLVAEWPGRLVPLLPTRLEWLVLPGAGAEERIWHVRGVPTLPGAWRRLLVGEEWPC
jgi:tRNA threonylcarbamoyladenosine biosynthesis protein TsaE